MNTRDGGEFVTVTVEEELIGVTEACATWMLEMLLPNRIYQILNRRASFRIALTIAHQLFRRACDFSVLHRKVTHIPR